jgi:hypothetical protein
VHAFVRHGEAVVGHYAVVPIRVRARGATAVSGKGEALFLAEAHRAGTVALEGGEVPAGIALMNALHDRALSEGLVVVHNITSPEIGMIQRMHGFRALNVSLDQLHYLIRPSELRALRESPSRARAGRALALAQRTLLTVSRGLLRLTRAPAVERNPDAHAERHLAALAATDAHAEPGWAISRDPETLRWLRRLGRLEIASIAGRPEHVAVISTGDARELLLWNVPDGARRSGLALACALLASSVDDGAWIVSAARRLAPEGSRSLRFVLRVLAFVPQSIPVTIYVKGPDPFYIQEANLDFSRVFHL